MGVKCVDPAHSRATTTWVTTRGGRTHCATCKADRKVQYNAKLKSDVLAAYGPDCACCGETDRRYLVIDHVGGGGNAHRRELSGRSFYAWLRQNGFPLGFQVLCANCNHAKEAGGCAPGHRPTSAVPLGAVV